MKTVIGNTLLVTAMAGVLGMAAVAFASPHECGERAGPEGRLEKHLDRMSSHLDLSDAQRTEIGAVLRSSQAEMMSLREQMHEGRRALHQLSPGQANFEAETARLASEQGDVLASLIQLKAKTRAELHPILTAEQREQMGEYMAEKRGHEERPYM